MQYLNPYLYTTFSLKSVVLGVVKLFAVALLITL